MILSHYTDFSINLDYSTFCCLCVYVCSPIHCIYH